MTPDQALKAVEKAANARTKAERALVAAQAEEERRIQDAWEALGGHRGNASKIAEKAKRTPEHVRKVIDPKFERGHYATASDA